MPTQLQLEGPDLETLLARVRAEHGASARIVRAEKVRSGGVGGFFAKQHFEINVEIEDAPAPAPAPASAPRATSILDLAEQVSATERSAAVSTESTGFQAVLARLGATAGEAAPEPVVQAPRPARAAAAPRTRRPAEPPAALIPRQRAASSPTTRSPRKPAAAPADATPAVRRIRPQAGAAGSPLVGTVVRAAAGPRPGTAVAVRAAAPAVAVRAAAPAPRPGTAVAVRAVAARPTAGSSVAVRSRGTVAVPASRATAAPATGVCRPARLQPEELAVQAQLVDLGLPEHLLPTTDRDRLHSALVDVLEQLPKAPRTANRAGSVIAIVGPLPLALEVARQIARELKLPARSSVVLATGLRTLTHVPESCVLREPEEARDRRPSWSRRKTTTLVVVDAPLTAGGAAGAREYLDALEPTATWAVVEATRKAHDVGAWTRSVGHVDALALTAVDDTADPAAVLGLGIPVGRIGSRRATPSTWASLLTNRIAA